MRKGILLILAILAISFLYGKNTYPKLKGSEKKQFSNAIDFMEEGKFQEALELLNLLTESNQDNISILKKIADIHYKQCNEQAKIEYESVLELINQKIPNEGQKKKEILEDYKIEVSNKLTAFTSGAFDERCKEKQNAVVEIENERDKAITENTIAKETNNEQQLSKPEDLLSDNIEILSDFRPKTESNVIITKSVPENNSLSDDYTYNDTVFASDWIYFISNKAVEQKIEIKKYIENNFFESKDGIDNIKPEFINKKTYKEIIALNRSWMLENSWKDYNWLEELKNKEATYFDTLYQYNEVIRGLASDELKLGTLEATVENLKQQKENEISNMEIIDNIIDVVLVDEIKSRLATIPQSIVLIGKINYATSDLEKIKLSLSDYMKDLARINIKGFNVLQNKLLHTHEYERRILDFYEFGFDGHAQTIDTFYKDLRKFDSNANEYIYLIHRIEVFPFKESSALAVVDDSNTSNLSAIPKNVYAVDQTNLQEMSTHQIVTFESLEISNEDTQDYIIDQNNFSGNRNIQYNKKIDEVIKTYKEKLNNNNQKKLSTSLKIERLKNQITEIGLKIVGLEKKIALTRANVKMNESTPNLYNRYNFAKNGYEQFYKSRIGVVNKLIHKIKNSRLHVTDLFYKPENNQGYVDEIFSVRSDLEKNDKEISIYLEYKHDGTSEFSYKKKQARFQPAFKAFRILSVGAITTPELTHSLNIAFKVDWDFVSPLCFTEQPPRIIDVDQQTQWLFLNSRLNPSSPLEYHSSLDEDIKFYKDEGWRLPTYDELMMIKGQLASEKNSKNDIFKKLGWLDTILDLENCSILTDKSFKANGNRYVSYNIFNENIKRIDLGRGDSCYLFLIKDCTEEDDCNCK